jgi:hypothetical protein
MQIFVRSWPEIRAFRSGGRRWSKVATWVALELDRAVFNVPICRNAMLPKDITNSKVIDRMTARTVQSKEWAAVCNGKRGT